MKSIKLTQGQQALIDDEDCEIVNRHTWCAFWDGYNWYAQSRIRKNGRQHTLLMHRVILNVTDPEIEIDHRDGNGLNNSRDNLRCVTHAQNMSNKAIYRNNTSGYKGVMWHSRDKVWHAQIRVNGKKKHLGYYDTPEQAAHAYDAAARELFGEFARPNFPMCVDCATDSNGGQQPTPGGPGA